MSVNPSVHPTVNQSSHYKRVCRGPSFSEVAQLYKQPIQPTNNQTINPTAYHPIHHFHHQRHHQPLKQPLNPSTPLQCHLATSEPSLHQSHDTSPSTQSIDQSIESDSEVDESFLDSADESSDEEIKVDHSLHNQAASHPLSVPHSWSDIVQAERHVKPALSQSLNPSLHDRVRSPRTPSGRRIKRGRRSLVHSNEYSPAARNFLQCYQLAHQSAHLAHQKHCDRVARLAHDQTVQRDQVITVLSCVLDQLFPLRSSDVLPSDVRSITVFHTERVPSIPISTYLQRLAQYTEVSSEVLIHALIHLNRLLHTRPSFAINSLNIHRLWLTSMLCSAKFFDDVYYNNAYFAKVGGIPNKELNDLEIEFLALINFDLFVDYNVYAGFCEELRASKLHTTCACPIHSMPPIQPQYYARPSEQIDERHSNIADLSSECELDNFDSVSVSSSRRGSLSDVRLSGQLSSRHRSERSRKRAAAQSYSPATTASTNSFCSVESGVSSTEEDDDDIATSEEDDEVDDDDLSIEPKLVDAGSLSKQVSSASTLSVSLAIDSLQVDGHAKQVQMSDSPCSSSHANTHPHNQSSHIQYPSHVVYPSVPFTSALPLHPYTHALIFAPPPTSHPTHTNYAAPPPQGAIVQTIM